MCEMIFAKKSEIKIELEMTREVSQVELYSVFNLKCIGDQGYTDLERDLVTMMNTTRIRNGTKVSSSRAKL